MRVLFTGNRQQVLAEAQRLFYVKTIPIISKKQIIRDIKRENFDILVSNGCPYILPVDDLKRACDKWVNVHPTYLPYYRGKSPLKEMHAKGVDYIGATLHHMDKGIDTGPIIYQEKKPFNGSLDERYKQSFELEAQVFKKGIYEATDF